ncbi:contactin-associated protein-like 2 isoform X1 [Oculina patagonica]
MALFLLLLVFLHSAHIAMVFAMEKSALYRNPTGDISFGNFKQNPFHYLRVENITWSMVVDQLDCAFLCVGEPKCYSFNMAAYPDSKGLCLCELLATDKYRATKKFHANASFHHYSPWSPCESDPCKNGADCVPEYELNSYRCHCKKKYYGIHCEHKVYKSCSKIKSHNPKATSGSYVIDPDGDGGVTPFTVDCDMTDKSKVGVTVISHDSEDRTPVSGCKKEGCYSRDVQYTGANLHQLGNLTAISAHCEQFIKYECHASVLLQNGGMYGWWVSRDGDKMTYWGGSNSSFPYKCACGVTGTCANNSYGCNCDINDAVWREDSGMLTNKSHLPVMQLRFGDTDYKNEHGNHTLGKLKCFGISRNN